MRSRTPILLLAGLVLAALGLMAAEKSASEKQDSGPTVVTVPEGASTAVFAGGCFWCMETAFEDLPGVKSVISGYAGGAKKNPTYQEVSAGGTGHAEVVLVVYDPTQFSYERLLEVFWHNIDPTTPDRQFCDVGSQYRSALFYKDDAQRTAAEKSRQAIIQSKPFAEEIVTQLEKLSTFYPAEAYHQDFYKKEPLHYFSYRRGCGRDKRLKALWGDKAGH